MKKAYRNVIQFGNGLLSEHGCEGWRTEVSTRMTSRFGVCYYRPKVIKIAAWLVDSGDWDQVEDTVRHEVAHAVTGPGHGHDLTWKRAAIKVGAKPERCGSGAVWQEHSVTAQRGPKGYLRCSKCPREWPRYRAPRRGSKYRCHCGADVHYYPLR